MVQEHHHQLFFSKQQRRPNNNHSQIIMMSEGLDAMLEVFEDISHQQPTSNRETALEPVLQPTNEQDVHEQSALAVGDEEPPEDEVSPVENKRIKPILSVDNQTRAKFQQQQTALGWFNKFLKELWSEPNCSKNLSKHGTYDSSRLFDYLEEDDLNAVDLVGCFCTYLTKTPADGGRDGFLSYGSAQSYVAQVSSYYTDQNCKVKLPKGKVDDCFGRSRYKSKSIAAMKTTIANRLKETGGKLVKEKPGASAVDWILIAMSAVLSGGHILAEFWAVCIAMTHFASRGKNRHLAHIQHAINLHSHILTRLNHNRQ